MMTTPCLMIDEDVLRANLLRMADACKKHGCALRPHVKTHKSVALAKLQMEYGASGITVAKLGEAEIMAGAGITDIFMAFPIVGEDKIRRAAALAKRIRLILTVDSIAGARALSLAAGSLGVAFEVRLELDTGMGRSGASPEKAVVIAKEIASLQNLDLRGISTYRSMLYNGEMHDDPAVSGLDEGRIMVDIAKRMRLEGLMINDVSVGSTATAVHCASAEGVTEVRPGTYVFQDRMQAAMGACDESMFAAHIEATVVSVKGSLIVIDAGTKSISTDCQPMRPPYNLAGFGKVLGHEGLTLHTMTEEHGMLTNNDPEDVIRLGDRLSIVPNHICTTVNLYDEAYWVNQGGISEPIRIDARGASR